MPDDPKTDPPKVGPKAAPEADPPKAPPFDADACCRLRFPGRPGDVTASLQTLDVVVYRDAQGRELHVETYSPTTHAG